MCSYEGSNVLANHWRLLFLQPSPARIIEPWVLLSPHSSASILWLYCLFQQTTLFSRPVKSSQLEVASEFPWLKLLQLFLPCSYFGSCPLSHWHYTQTCFSGIIFASPLNPLQCGQPRVHMLQRAVCIIRRSKRFTIAGRCSEIKKPKSLKNSLRLPCVHSLAHRARTCIQTRLFFSLMALPLPCLKHHSSTPGCLPWA